MRLSGVLRPSPLLRSIAPLLVCTVSLLLIPAVHLYADTARLSGTVFTVDHNHVQTVWPNARVTLKSLHSGRELTTVTNELGKYFFAGVLPGEYEVSVALAGFAVVTRRVTLTSTNPTVADFQLVPQSNSESVTVNANPTGIDTSSSSGGGPVLTTPMLKSLVRLNDDFQEALPLLPGVLRGPDGLIRIKGGNANQANALINNASIGDPFTGQPTLRLPNAAVESMRVLSNPFSAEFGDFSSGVIEVTTRGGGDEWKWLFEDPIPRFRWIDYRTHGVESLTPHLAFSGPLIKGKLYIFQSLYYGYDTTRVPSLPNPNNTRVDQRVNTQTQLDWDLNASHRLTAILTLDPQNTDYANINQFNPQPVTNDFRQRGLFTSFSDRWIFANGGFVESLFSAKLLDFHLFPEDSEPGVMILFPEQNSGSFFETQQRHTWLYQWTQALHLHPLGFAGRHLLTFGYAFSRSTYNGTISNLPVEVLREDRTLSSEISYSAAMSSSVSENDLSLYVQDNWQVFSRLTLDLGVRLDRASLSAEALNAAPRIGFVYAPMKDGRTAIRGGLGLFYDKIPLNVAAFRDIPAQTVTGFAADGTTIVAGPTAYTHVITTDNRALRLPYSFGSTLQVDHRLRRNFLLRLGYEHREGYREFYVNPVGPSNSLVSPASTAASIVSELPLCAPLLGAIGSSTTATEQLACPALGQEQLMTASQPASATTAVNGFIPVYSTPHFSPAAIRYAQLQLLNSGTQRYDEFLAMLRWNPSERTSIVASYVYSRAFGELNDYNQFFGNNPYPLIRPNQYGPLPSDAPNRILFWGIIGLPHKLQLVPILDVHTGFPYSKLDQDWNYIGGRNQAGRFPTFISPDLKLQYPFDFQVRGHRIQFLGGLKVIDVTNHYNPRDVQQYFDSPHYGGFYNSVGRLWRIDGDFDF
jgi:hypothetical protein